MKNNKELGKTLGAKPTNETHDEPATFDGGQAEHQQAEMKKERTPNTIYTLKQMRNMINKIAIQKMASVEELTQLRTIHKAMTER